MTIPLWCLLIGAVLPYALAGAAVPFRLRKDGAVNLDEPRTQAETLTDGGARAVAAQDNAWEALGVFTGAVLINHLAGAGGAQLSAILASAWVVLRIGHGFFYIRGNPTLRVACFVGGMIAAFALALTAAL